MVVRMNITQKQIKLHLMHGACVTASLWPNRFAWFRCGNQQLFPHDIIERML